MTLIQRHMFFGLIARTAGITAIFTLLLLFITTSKLFILVVHGAMPASHFLLALVLLLPMEFYLVVPITVSIAVAYAYHEWMRHNEILSLRSAGLRNSGLALPGLAAGLVAMIFTGVMSLYVLPIAWRHFEDIRYNAGYYNFTPDILDEGFLQTVAPDISLSFQRRLGPSVVQGVTILDGSKPDAFTYIFADRGRFVTRPGMDPENVIILEHGSYMVRHGKEEQHLTPVAFEDLMVPLVRKGNGLPKVRKWRGFFEQRIEWLLNPPKAELDHPLDYGQAIAEGHKRILMPVLCLSYVAFVLGVILWLRHDRSGWVLPMVGIASAIALWHGLIVATHSFVVQEPSLAPVYYVVAFTPGIVGTVLLVLADRARAMRRRASPGWAPALEGGGEASGP